MCWSTNRVDTIGGRIVFTNQYTRGGEATLRAAHEYRTERNRRRLMHIARAGR